MKVKGVAGFRFCNPNTDKTMSRQLKTECLNAFILSTPFNDNASVDRQIFERKNEIERARLQNMLRQQKSNEVQKASKQKKIDYLQRELKRLQG